MTIINSQFWSKLTVSGLMISLLNAAAVFPAQSDASANGSESFADALVYESIDSPYAERQFAVTTDLRSQNLAHRR